MRKGLKIKFFFLAIFSLLIVVFKYSAGKDKGKHIALPKSLPAEYLKSGYLICRHGDGFWSEAIIKQQKTDKRFSHIGIISTRDGNAAVIHADTSNHFALSGQVVQESLDSFLIHARRIGIFKVKQVNPVNLEQKAYTYIGRPFDWKFNAKDNKSIYCSELIKLAIDEVAPQSMPEFSYIKLGRNEIIPIDVFISPEFSEEIYDVIF